MMLSEMSAELETAHGLNHKRDLILVSRSSILLLSGILMGMALREGVVPWAHFHGFFIGLTGLIAYFGLEVVSRRKAEREVREAHDRMVNILNSRIEKLVARSDGDYPVLSMLSAREIPVVTGRVSPDHASGTNVNESPQPTRN
jgi:hypothetical protein